jgi:hypothetical protein
MNIDQMRSASPWGVLANILANIWARNGNSRK